jgi:ribose 5-phosphate isomerase
LEPFHCLWRFFQKVEAWLQEKLSLWEERRFIGPAFITDQGNEILDIKDLDISNPEAVEALLNNIPGVVDNGIFAFNKPKKVLVSG